ncbi:MAG TPA: kelch repeat-containing protein [Pirellulales bacterium]|jgi:N-acetylneuraminic acid mutarotase|nr:kelch repeat-containing protein [Pirellulales bacterium]
MRKRNICFPSTAVFQLAALAALLTPIAAGDVRAAEAGSPSASVPSSSKIAELPVGIASFGAALDGDWLYVYGGHTGETHSYSTEEVTDAFRRVNVREGGAWENLPTGPALQGLALVSDGGYLYRIGGMVARNKPADADDLWSLTDVARFDPRTRQWTAMTPLPEGRSSHGAVVVDGRLYVIAGWELRGAQGPRWHTTSLVLDLAAKQPEWKELPKQPFERRALAAEAAGGKLLVTGGLIQGGISSQTDVFDLKSQTWSKGADIPGSKMNAIGMAACTQDGRIYVNGMDGTIYRLGQNGASWESVGKMQPPRFHHHLFALQPGVLLSVGGATRTGKVLAVESVEVSRAAAH